MPERRLATLAVGYPFVADAPGSTNLMQELAAILE
jgi:hypothetical protein